MKALVILSLILVTGCARQSDSQRPVAASPYVLNGPPGQPNAIEPLRLTISAPGKLEVGDPLDVVATVTNTGDRHAPLFESGTESIEWEVTQNGKPYLRLTDLGKAYPPWGWRVFAGRSLARLAPKGEYTNTVRLSNYYEFIPGSYVVIAEYLEPDGVAVKLRSNSAAFDVVAKK